MHFLLVRENIGRKPGLERAKLATALLSRVQPDVIGVSNAVVEDLATIGARVLLKPRRLTLMHLHHVRCVVGLRRQHSSTVVASNAVRILGWSKTAPAGRRATFAERLGPPRRLMLFASNVRFCFGWWCLVRDTGRFALLSLILVNLREVKKFE
jgi:hypothetical protein